jgi:hypothetical protein
MKSSSSSSCLDLSRPRMLLTMEAALDATLVGAFDGAFDAGAGGEGDELRSLRLLLLCSLCELCFEDEV